MFAEAQNHYEQALEIRVMLLGKLHPLVAAIMGNIAGLYANKKNPKLDYNVALSKYDEALAIHAGTGYHEEIPWPPPS
jgi:hypothetical protein